MRDIIQQLQAHAKHSFVLVHAPNTGAQLTIEDPRITLTFSPDHPGEIWLVMDLDLSAEQAERIVNAIKPTEP